MANVIKHKRGSGSDPVASDLVVGEVAIRTDVGKLFTKMDNGSVAEIAGGGSDIAINTLSSSSGTGGGSATFNGSAYRFTLSQPPNVSAAQLLVSINGVIQKPVAGTGQPSEGFSVDGNDIILGDAPATGSDFFILTFRSLGVSVPADNSVTSAKIVDGAIVNTDINASAAIARTKLANVDLVDDTSPQLGGNLDVNTKNILFGDSANTNDDRLKFGAGEDLQIFHNGANSLINNTLTTGSLFIKGNSIQITSFTNTEKYITGVKDGAVELYYDNVKKFETFSGGISVTGQVNSDGSHMGDNDKALFGNSNDLQIYHDGNNSVINNDTGGLYIKNDGVIEFQKASSGETKAKFISDGAVELYHDNSKKFETRTGGVTITGSSYITGNDDHPDNSKARFGTSDDLQIYHQSSDNNSYIVEGGSGSLMIQGDVINLGNVGTSEYYIRCFENGSVQLRHDNSTKIETTSGGAVVTGFLNVTTGIHIPDGGNNDNSITIGSGNDLRLYHDGSTSHVQDNVSNVLRISSDSIALQSGDKSEAGLVYSKNGSVDLYFDNSKKFETNSTGTIVTGQQRFTNTGVASSYIGANSDGGVFGTDTAGLVLKTGVTGGDVTTTGTPRMIIDSSGNVLIGTTSSEDTTGNSGPKLLHTGDFQIDGDQKSLVFRSTNSTAQKQSGIQWWNENGAGVQCAIFGIREAVNQAPSALAFYTSNNVDTSSNGGQGNITNRMLINSVGEVRIQHETDSDSVTSTDCVHGIGNTSLDTVTTNLARLVMQERQGNWISFKQGSGAHFGTIAQVGSNVSYGGQSSDYRIKENIVNVSNGITLLKQLRPVNFNYTSDSGFTTEEQAKVRIGFIAHEFAEICPTGVIGEKDGMDIWGDCTNSEGETTQTHVPENKKKEGETWTEKSRIPNYQQIDFSKAVPILTAALQEAIGRIEALEAK